MAIVNPNIPPKRIALTNMLLMGVMQRMAEAFDVPPERVVPISTSDRMAVMKRVAEKHSKGVIQFPQIMCYLTNFIRGDAEPESGRHAKTLARHGVRTKIDDNTGAVQRLHLIPTIIEMEILYQVDDYFKGIDYATRWMSAGLHMRLNFTITYMNLPMDIRVELANQVVVPQRDESIDIPNFFEFDSSIKLYCFTEDNHPDDEDRVSMLKQLKQKYELTTDISQTPEIESPAEFSTVR